MLFTRFDTVSFSAAVNVNGGHADAHTPVQGTAWPALVKVYSVLPCASTSTVPTPAIVAVATWGFTFASATPDPTPYAPIASAAAATSAKPRTRRIAGREPC